MEGGGPGLGAAPQYEEQLLHTQVENLKPGFSIFLRELSNFLNFHFLTKSEMLHFQRV